MWVAATSIVGTIVAVSIVAAVLAVDAGSTSTPVGMVGTMIVTFAAAVVATVTFTAGRNHFERSVCSARLRPTTQSDSP